MFQASMKCLSVAILVTACSMGPQTTPTTTSIRATDVAIQTSPSVTASSLGATDTSPMNGTPPGLGGHHWSFLTTQDGLCTDWPLFIGGTWIGTGGASICSVLALSETVTSPDEARVTSASQFPPNGGLEIATETGVCSYSFGEWRCVQEIAGTAMQGVRQILPLETEAVYRFDDRVMLQSGHLFDLKAMVGEADVRSTWMAISGSRQGGVSPAAELWIGTERQGIIVIDVATGESRRYQVADGLPSQEIRDVQAEQCPKLCDYRDVWVATSGGVANWDGSEWHVYTSESGLPTNDVRGLVIWRRNDVWAATGAGVGRFDGQGWAVVDNGIPELDLTGTIGMGPERVGFGTRGHGILVYEIGP